jgi:fibronectin type 3 domain-containing protein
VAADTRACRRLAALALALAAFAGCASTAERAAERLFEREQTLVYDRASNLLPPEGLRVTSNEDRQIALAWDPVLVGDVQGYVILRASGTGSGTGNGDFERVGLTHSRFGTVFTDRGASPGALGDGQTYAYRVHPYDRLGRVSRSHAALSATTQPRPDVPQGLQVYSNLPRSAVLSWRPSEARSVAGYAIYRCPTMAGPWERVAFVEGRLTTVHEDAIPGDLRVMYYRISAVNQFGGESEQTEVPIRAVTKAEPLPPIELAANARSLGEVELNWAPNVEPDLSGYEVWRAVQDGEELGEEARIADVAAGTTAFADAGVGCGERARYRLRAIDTDGLVSSYSEPLEVTGQDAGVSLARRGDAVVLAWDPKLVADLTAVSVLEVRGGLPDRELATASNGGELALPALDSGTRLAVRFQRAGGATETAPCLLAVP